MIKFERFYMEQALKDFHARQAQAERLVSIAEAALGAEYLAHAADAMNDAADMIAKTASVLRVDKQSSTVEWLDEIHAKLDEFGKRVG